MREILFRGKKIHEEDIVKLSEIAYRMSCGCEYGVVKYWHDKFIILIPNDELETVFQCSLDFGLGHVVGNTKETPEFLHSNINLNFIHSKED